MLYRKIRSKIEDFLRNSPNKILLVEGARQIGKTYIIRDVGDKMFPNFIEINMAEDKVKCLEYLCHKRVFCRKSASSLCDGGVFRIYGTCSCILFNALSVNL